MELEKKENFGRKRSLSLMNKSNAKKRNPMKKRRVAQSKMDDATNMDIEPPEEIQIEHDKSDTFEDMNIVH